MLWLVASIVGVPSCSQAEDNLGMPMVYTLVSAVQDKLQEFSDMVKEEKDRQQREAQEEERRREEVMNADRYSQLAPE